MNDKLSYVIDKIKSFRNHQSIPMDERWKKVEYLSKLLNDKSYKELKYFYEMNPSFVRAHNIINLLNDSSNEAQDIINMLLDKPLKFKFLYTELLYSLETKMQIRFNYNENERGLNQIIGQREMGSYTEFDGKKITTSYKTKIDIKEITEYLFFTKGWEKIFNNLAEKGILNEKVKPSNQRMKFIEFILNEENQKKIFNKCAEDEKKYVKNLVEYFKSEKVFWDLVLKQKSIFEKLKFK